MPQPRISQQTHSFGFTLAELLISLAILGVIATFTIPKILSTQQNSQYNAAAKETVAMVAASLAQYQKEYGVTSATGMQNLTPYMNYVAVDTTSNADDHPGGNAGTTCGTSVRCLRLHSGGLLIYDNGNSFGGTTSTYAVWFNIDPDARQASLGSATSFYLYANGRISSQALADPNTILFGGPAPVGPGYPPPTWFSW